MIPTAPAPPMSNSAKRPNTRKRAALACEECRVRKRRCDGGFPACEGCIKRDSDCQYASSLQPKAWDVSEIQSLRLRLEELERAEPAAAAPPLDASHSLTHIPEALPPGNPPSTRGAGEEATTGPVVEGSLATRGGSDGSRPGSDLTLQGTPPARDWSEAADVAMSGISRPRMIEKLMQPFDQAIARREGGRFAVSDGSQTSDAARRTSMVNQGCHCDQTLKYARWSLPLKATADSLIALYFSTVHLVYPVLHQGTFVKQYSRLWQNDPQTDATKHDDCTGICKGNDKGEAFASMVHVMFATASLFESNSLEQNRLHADEYFRIAQRIDLLDLLEGEVELQAVQLGLLMGFYLQSTERFSKCWNIAGLTIRMAQSIGLPYNTKEAHRRGFLNFSADTQISTEMRSRVWHCCVLLDSEISMSFGRPMMSARREGNRSEPQPIDDCYLSGEPGKINKQPDGIPSHMESFIQLTRLYDLLGQLLVREDTRNPVSPGTTTPQTFHIADIGPQSLLTLDTSIMEWQASLPVYLRHETSSSQVPAADSLTPHEHVSRDAMLQAQAKRLYLRFLFVRVLILRPALDLLLQRQFEASAAPPSSGSSGVQGLLLSGTAAQCLSTSVALINVLNEQIQSRDLLAWWYNIGYLHAAGTTLLIGLSCELKYPDILSGRETCDLDVCLQCIARYASLSIVARKSHHLLRDGAIRIARREKVPSDTGGQLASPSSHSAAPGHILPDGTNSTVQSGNGQNIPQIATYMDSTLRRVADATFSPKAHLSQYYDVFADEAWMNEQGEGVGWSFTPYFSQLQ